MTCLHELDDGAYILGALVPAERADFERHLASCAPCRNSIAQLAVLPGLLGRLNPDTAQPTVTAPATLLPRVLAAARASRQTQRRRRLLITVTAAAIALAAAVGVGVQLDDTGGAADDIPQFHYAVMHASQEGEVDAEIGIQAQETGTLVAVRCVYHENDERPWPIWLVVYPRTADGAEPIGSWVATPGVPVEVTAVTHYPPALIARIELQSRNQRTVAWWSP